MSQSIAQYPEPIADNGSILANKGKSLVGLVVLVVALGYFAFMAFQSATVYYYTVSEMDDVGATPEGRSVRVSGKLVASSFSRDEGTTLAHFTLTDGTQVLEASHDGVVPELFFNEHSEIILEGSHTPGGVFQSQNVIVKCPSKYVVAEDDVG